jgi:inorganic triphosphatase YgiF
VQEKLQTHNQDIPESESRSKRAYALCDDDKESEINKERILRLKKERSRKVSLKRYGFALEVI